MEIDMKITKDTRRLIMYMAMGDGCLHNKAGYFSVRHCLGQEEYLIWKWNLLRKHISVTKPYFVDNNGYGSFEFRTRSYKFIKLYRKVLYKGGSKNFSKKVLKKLTPLGLAIWYMDDGGLSQKKRDGEVVANELMINTHLSKEENQVIIDYFSETWDIHFTQCKNRGKYRLRCGTKEARKFLKIIEPYISQVKCMAHKANVKPESI